MSTSSRVECSHASCHCSFESEASMNQHLKDRHAQHNDQGKLPCQYSYCNRSFTTKGALQEHLIVVHGESPAASNFDDFEDSLTPPPPSLLGLDQQPEDDLACNDCGRLFETTDSLHLHQWDSPDHIRVSRSRFPNRGNSIRACSQCDAKFRSANHLEQHYMDCHPISELNKSGEDGTWRYVAESFRLAWKKPTIKLHEVHRIFKVYNPGWRRGGFEQYRKELKKEMANQKFIKEDNLELRNTVLRDGNELRRYHGTNVKCQLGRPPAKNPEISMEVETTASLCADHDCSLCRILQTGFKKGKCRVERFQRFGAGIYCSSISSKASAYVNCSDSSAGYANKSPSFSFWNQFLGFWNLVGSNAVETSNYKVMMACKVLAGRPFCSTRNMKHLEGPPKGFHSVQGDPGAALNYDELVVYDDRAILPEFIILYSSSD